MGVLGGFAADLLALATAFRALLDDLVGLLVGLTSLGAGGAGFGIGHVGKAGERAMPGHHRRREDTEGLAVHRKFVDLGMRLEITLVLADGFEAVVGRLVADLGALGHDLEMVIVIMMLMIVIVIVIVPGEGPTLGEGQGGGSEAQGSEDFTSIHRGLHSPVEDSW